MFPTSQEINNANKMKIFFAQISSKDLIITALIIINNKQENVPSKKC